jgi:arylsulfatase A-like enzyme/Flp pilus assembly protein TadD
MRKVIAALLAGLLIFCACGRKSDRPNVVLIIVDTLRADALGCYGNSRISTPTADGLASGGVLFSQCITAAPVTLPSISSILTSSYPMYHGARDNGLFVLDESLVTLAESFMEAGYSTGAVVGAYVIAEHSGIAQGFDQFDADFSGSYLNESSLLRERAEEVAKTQRRASEVTELAVEWLEGTDGPFFLLVHYFDPHGPYDPPKEYLEKYGVDMVSKYVGEVAYTDTHLAPLLQAAETAAGGSDLLTVFVADHGEGLKEHGETQHGFFLYDSTVRVPLILKYPGHIMPATVSHRPVPTVDLAPTILDLVGLSVPESWQGRSFAAEVAISGIEDEPPAEVEDPEMRPCYMETFRTRYSYNWSELLGVRHDLWKFVRAPKPELYNLAEDPGEQSNLYTDRPDMAASMGSLLDELIGKHSGPLGDLGPSVELDQEEIDKLEALGYVMPEKKAPSGPLPDPKDQIAGLNRRLDSKELVKQARVLMNRNELEEARRGLERALELDPKNSVAIHDIGAIHFKKGEFEEALPYFERSVQLTPANPIPREHLGMTYMRLKRPEEAARELETAVALEPEKADLRLGCGLAMMEAGDPSGALQQFYKAMELDPDLAPAYYRAAMALASMGRLDEAVNMLQELLAKNPPKRLAELSRRLLADIEKRRGR